MYFRVDIEIRAGYGGAFRSIPVSKCTHLKQPVSKHGSFLLGEMIAIKMVLDIILKELHQKSKLNKVLILSDSQSSVGLLTLGWEATPHKSTAKDVISKLDLIKGKGIDVEIKWTPGHAEIKGNDEADRLAKEASKEAELKADEGTCSSQPELKQAGKTHGLTVWQDLRYFR